MSLRRIAPVVLSLFAVLSLLLASPAGASLFGDRTPDEFEAERYMFRLINDKRAHITHPVPRLTLDTQLRRDARDNSDSMASSERFESPRTSSRGACATLGRRENSDYKTAMNQIFKEWVRIANPGTRSCLLDASDRFGAVGVKRGPSFTYWVTFIAARGQSRR